MIVEMLKAIGNSIIIITAKDLIGDLIMLMQEFLGLSGPSRVILVHTSWQPIGREAIMNIIK